MPSVALNPCSPFRTSCADAGRDLSDVLGGAEKEQPGCQRCFAYFAKSTHTQKESH